MFKDLVKFKFRFSARAIARAGELSASDVDIGAVVQYW